MPAVGSILQDIARLWETVKANAEAQASKDQQAANQARRASNITEGDLVLLSTRHLQLKSSPGKMKPRFIGPFRAIQSVGANAFKLQLPESMKVHPIFNVSLLRKYHGEYSPPGPIIVEGEAEYEVERIIRHHRNGKRRQFLVRWKGYDDSEDCWLKADELDNAPLVLKRYLIQ